MTERASCDLFSQGAHDAIRLSVTDMREYLQFVADRRMERLDLEPIYGSGNPLAFMELQDARAAGTRAGPGGRPRPTTGPTSAKSVRRSRGSPAKMVRSR
jgi:hypothetical protein